MGWEQNGDEPRSMALPFNLDLFPVTAVTVVLAAGITLGWWLGKDIGVLGLWDRLPGERLLREPWRFATHTLPHGNVFHIVFNAVFMVRFGRKIEGRYGTWPTLGIFLLTGVTAGAAQYLFSYGGIGLSGVVYGLFGYLWIMSRLDDRELYGALHPSTVNWMVGWIVVGSLLSAGGAPIGNTAHLAGAVYGGLLAKTVGTDPRRRLPWIVGLAVATAWLLGCSIWARELMNVPHLLGWRPLA